MWRLSTIFFWSSTHSCRAHSLFSVSLVDLKDCVVPATYLHTRHLLIRPKPKKALDSSYLVPFDSSFIFFLLGATNTGSLGPANASYLPTMGCDPNLVSCQLQVPTEDPGSPPLLEALRRAFLLVVDLLSPGIVRWASTHVGSSIF
jgi:hypothetical protein